MNRESMYPEVAVMPRESSVAKVEIMKLLNSALSTISCASTS